MLAAIGVLALGMAGCGGSDDSGGTNGGSGGSGGAEKKVNIAFLNSVGQTGYGQAMMEGIQAAVAKEGGDVTMFDAALDPQKQNAQCQDALQTGKFTGIVIYAVDAPSAAACARQAQAKGVPVGATGTAIGPDPASVEKQVDGLAGLVIIAPSDDTKAQVELTATACEGIDPCNVVRLIANRAFAYTSIRLQQEKPLLAEHSNIKVIAVAGPSNYTADGGRKAMQDVLQRTKDVHVIAADDDFSGLGGLQAAEAAGVTGVKVIGDGASREAVEGIRSGKLFATVPYVPRSSAQRATELVIEAIRTGKLEFQWVDEATLTGVGTKLTKDNVDKFEAQWSNAG
jgi:ABC-type sugar transport system substrate-binding protein